MAGLSSKSEVTGARLHGKTAIITGAGSGVGAATARLFVQKGARVILTDRNEGSGTQTAEEIGENAYFLRADVSDEQDWREVVRLSLARFGGIDILVNSAGIFHKGAFSETDLAALESHYRVNVIGTFLGMKAVTVPMGVQRAGSIINISSGVALRGSAGVFAYASSKWMVRGLSKCAAVDLAGSGIRVNSVVPGLIETPMIAENSPQSNAAIAAFTPMGRLGLADEVACAVLYLASDESSFVSGAEMVVDGGLFA